jgi:hypothetical protein
MKAHHVQLQTAKYRDVADVAVGLGAELLLLLLLQV